MLSPSEPLTKEKNAENTARILESYGEHSDGSSRSISPPWHQKTERRTQESKELERNEADIAVQGRSEQEMRHVEAKHTLSKANRSSWHIEMLEEYREDENFEVKLRDRYLVHRSSAEDIDKIKDRWKVQTGLQASEGGSHDDDIAVFVDGK